MAPSALLRNDLALRSVPELRARKVHELPLVIYQLSQDGCSLICLPGGGMILQTVPPQFRASVEIHLQRAATGSNGLLRKMIVQERCLDITPDPQNFLVGPD